MLIKRFISFVAAAVLAVTTLPMATLAQAESLNNFVLIEGNETQHILTYIEGLTAILEVDGLKFKDHNKNGSLDVYEDWRVDSETRVQDLISQMTVREKIAQMQHPTFVPKAGGKVPSYLEKWSTDENIGLVLVRELDSVENAAKTMNQVQEWAEASRLGVPIVVSMDSVHGTSYVYGATVTPHNLGLAATRNEELVSKLADIARQEHIAIGTRMTLSPEADIGTEPRWGRVMETFGEDADLVTKMIRAQIVGFQNGDEGLNEDSIMACIKHFPGSGPQMDGIDMAPIVSDEETLQYHLKPYYAALEVNVASIMPYYSSSIYLDISTAALGSKAILQDLLREEMGFDGLIQTDWGMIWAIQQTRALFEGEISEEEAVLVGVMEGQVDGIGGESIRLIDTMETLHGEGKITDEVLNAACRRVLLPKFQMGVFENPYCDVAYAIEYVGNDESRALSLQAARESMTLLKNDNILPYDSTGKKILVTGLRAGDMDSLCGGWSSAQPGLTIEQALKEYAKEGATVVYAAEDLEQMKAEAVDADLIIAVVGEPSYMHSSAWGTEDLSLTNSQKEMMKVLDATGKPIVTVVINGRPLILTWCAENTEAILMAYYPGTEGGIAIAETLYGMNNPSGKLPVQLPRDMESVLEQSGDVAFDLENPLYDYGYGLSYTE
ncbi:MAG: glycoside hydrolase family 3 N-terminal domain-containing protein [Christensenellales bacterium]